MVAIWSPWSPWSPRSPRSLWDMSSEKERTTQDAQSVSKYHLSYVLANITDCSSYELTSLGRHVVATVAMVAIGCIIRKGRTSQNLQSVERYYVSYVVASVTAYFFYELTNYGRHGRHGRHGRRRHGRHCFKLLL